jgi:hypothetical protein
MPHSRVAPGKQGPADLTSVTLALDYEALPTPQGVKRRLITKLIRREGGVHLPRVSHVSRNVFFKHPRISMICFISRAMSAHIIICIRSTSTHMGCTSIILVALLALVVIGTGSNTSSF